MTDRERRISFVTVWGAACNLVLTILKLCAGIFGHSAAMVADAVHSLSDLVSDAVVLVMVRISSKGTDKSHDYGHGKFETLATLTVSLFLMAVAIEMVVDNVSLISSVFNGKPLEKPSMVALWAAVLSIVVKEVLYRWTAAEGRRLESPAMIANAWHHRSDALSSIGSLVGIGGAILLGGVWTVLDPIVGCLIGVVIFAVSLKMAGPAIAELMEASLPDDVENEIMEIINSIDKIDSVHALKTRRSGRCIVIDADVVVNPEMTVALAHGLTVEAERALCRRFGPDTQISLHIEPSEDAD
ncbi:MAG: cation diffusion facilitator family transporter [Bacteroidales bacterium]|nr:cation diffusion facilitator family transporter [Bacteroidales bacterium]